MKLIALLIVLLSFSQALDLNFSGNVTLSNEDEYKFRTTFASTVNIPGVYKGVFYKSVGAGAGNGQASTDVLVSAAVSIAGSAPSTYVSYFAANAGVTNSSDPFDISFGASSSLVATTYIAVEEVDVNGNVVAEVDLSGVFDLGDLVAKAGLNVQTIFNKFDDGFQFNLSAVFSDRIGVLDVVGKPVVTPKSLETLLTLSGWKYEKPENSLVLSMGVGSANLNVVGNAQFSAGTGVDGVYLNLGTQASVDGNGKEVKVSALTDLSLLTFKNLALATQVKIKYPTTASFKLVKVTFPAGANNIVWDPTIGAGANPPAETASASKFGIVAVFLLALLF